MERHMGEEEQALFPRIAALASAAADGAAPTSPNDAMLDELVHAMEDDHEHAGGIMRRIRGLTADYQPPEGACASYRASFAILSEFEDDLHRHVHLENNVLFPGAARLLKRREPQPEGAARLA
jgi:regulator of cell morphogenesis and NO signaling